MREYISVGPSPAEEPCAQVGDSDYRAQALAECRRFIELIRRTVGMEPPGARLAVKAFPHDFGTYHEVVCYYEEDDEAAGDYAFRCESEAPARWDS